MAGQRELAVGQRGQPVVERGGEGARQREAMLRAGEGRACPAGPVRIGDRVGNAVGGGGRDQRAREQRSRIGAAAHRLVPTSDSRDRKSAVSGKSVSVRVERGGRRTMKKKTTQRTTTTNY